MENPRSQGPQCGRHSTPHSSRCRGTAWKHPSLPRPRGLTLQPAQARWTHLNRPPCKHVLGRSLARSNASPSISVPSHMPGLSFPPPPPIRPCSLLDSQLPVHLRKLQLEAPQSSSLPARWCPVMGVLSLSLRPSQWPNCSMSGRDGPAKEPWESRGGAWRPRSPLA